MQYNLGIDIGGTFIRTGLISEHGELIEFSKVSSENLTIESLLDLIEEKIVGLQIRSISIGVPATVSKDKKKILSATFLHALNNINIVDAIEQRFAVKVYLDKDVNFILYRDIDHYKLHNQDSVCGVYLGTGIGCSMYINQKFISGKNGVAGELGHIAVYKNTNECGCGNIGCLESIACGRKLHQMYSKKYSDRDFNTIFDNYENDQELQDFIYGLSLSVSTIINILDPDTIILGGGVLSINSFPKKEFENFIFNSLRKPFPHDNINIIYTNDSQEIGIVGGGLYAWDQNNK